MPKIIREGVVPTCCYRGTCHQCQCIVEYAINEVRHNKSKMVKCPTDGCDGSIILRLTNRREIDPCEPYVLPWIKPIPKPYGEPHWRGEKFSLEAPQPKLRIFAAV